MQANREQNVLYLESMNRIVPKDTKYRKMKSSFYKL